MQKARIIKTIGLLLGATLAVYAVLAFVFRCNSPALNQNVFGLFTIQSRETLYIDLYILGYVIMIAALIKREWKATLVQALLLGLVFTLGALVSFAAGLQQCLTF